MTTLAHTKTHEALDTLTASLVARQSRSDDGSASVADQIDAMRDFCAKQGWLVGGIYEERDVSGRRSLDKRHGLKSAVDDIESGASQVVLTAYFDRFVRSVATRAEVVQRVERAGGIVMTLDAGRTSNATAADKLSGTLLAAIAEFYADQTGEKLVISKQRNIDRGVPPFPRITPAYQRRADGTLEPHPTNAPLIAEACRLRCEGASFTTIHRFLAANGIEISLSRVESTLTSKLLIGELHFGSFTPNLNSHEAIIDKATHRKLCSMRASRGRHSKSDRLLARQSVLVCETCGSKMTASSSLSSKGGKSYAYYRCGARHECAAPASVAADLVEQLVRDAAIEASKSFKGRASAKSELEAARVAAETASTKLSNAIRTLAGLDDEAATRETLDELQLERDRAVARHEQLASVVTPDRTISTLRDWDALTLDEQRSVVRSTIARVAVAPGRGDDRVSITTRELLSE